MGHAGAIISAFADTAAEKSESMRRAGLEVATSPALLGATMASVVSNNGINPGNVREAERSPYLGSRPGH